MAKKAFIGQCDKFDYIDKSKKIVVIGEPLGDFEHYSFQDVIMYKYYYDLLQRVCNDYQIILNNILVNGNRYALNYNCIRKYVLQTNNVILFADLPIKNNCNDVMILYDMLQPNPFLKERFEDVDFNQFELISDVDCEIIKHDIELTSEELEQYQKEKIKITKQVNKDPDIIPRRLLKWSEAQNAKRIKDLDSKLIFKRKMQIGVNNTNVDKYYYDELLNVQKEYQYAIQRISR